DEHETRNIWADMDGGAPAHVRTVSTMYSAAAPKIRFGAQAASVGVSTPPSPIALHTCSVTQYAIDSAMPMPMPYIAPRRPVVTANGIASSVMTIVANGNATFRCSLTVACRALNPRAFSWEMCSDSWPYVILSGSGSSVWK